MVLTTCENFQIKYSDVTVTEKAQKNLLIITDVFPDEHDNLINSKFVKTQVNALKDSFDNVYVIAVLSYYYKFTDIGKYCHDYEYDNVHVYFPYKFFIPLRFTRKFLIDFRYKAVIDVIEKNNLKFDLVHGHMTQPSGLICMKLHEKFHVPYVLTIHENGLWFADEIKLGHYSIIDSWKNADALIRVNKNDIPLLKEWNENSYYIPNIYSPKYYPIEKDYCREKLGISKDAYIIFSLGNLIVRKGFNYLIEAVSLLNDTEKEMYCYIGGKGKEEKHLLELISQLHMDRYVHLIGRISDEEVKLWMNAADIFVLPSLNESFGVVNIEAMACGTPVISTNAGGVPSIICDSKYGLMAEPGDVSDLIRCITEAYGTKWDEKIIREYVENTYSQKAVAKQLLDIYDSIM